MAAAAGDMQGSSDRCRAEDAAAAAAAADDDDDDDDDPFCHFRCMKR